MLGELLTYDDRMEIAIFTCKEDFRKLIRYYIKIIRIDPNWYDSFLVLHSYWSRIIKRNVQF